MGPSLFTRSGVVISAVGHGAGLLLAVLFTGASPFDSVATEAIAVDIVSPSEAPPVPEPPGSLSSDPSRPPNPQFDIAASPPPPPPMATPSPPQPQPDAKPADKDAPARSQRRERQQTERPSAEARAKVQGAGNAPPTAQPQAAPPQMPQAPSDGDNRGDSSGPKETNVANMFGMPLALPDGRLGGAFDAPASETAALDRGSVDAFRSRIKSCATLPESISPSERISLVLRVGLKVDGTLAGQPALIEASASPKGPALLQSLLAGLKKCQPFNMLPADKYKEWKSLDIRFTPQDLG